jgi:hypothetical protein
MPFTSRLRFVLLCCLLGTAGWGAEPSGMVPLGPGIAVDHGRREVHLDATVCLREGILEYLICRSHSFEHESVFVTPAKPSLLHAALLLIACEPDAYTPDGDWPAPGRRQARLAIEVEYTIDGILHRRGLERFARNRERADGVVGDLWIFTGSLFSRHDGEEHYAADGTGGVVGLTPKGASVVQSAERTGIPYHGDERGLECRPDTIPPLGTAVRIVIRASAQPAERADR